MRWTYFNILYQEYVFQAKPKAYTHLANIICTSFMPNPQNTNVFQYMHDAVGANYTDCARNLPSPPSPPPHSSSTITTLTTNTSTTVMHAHVSSSVYLMSQYASYIYIYICISMLLQTLYYHRWEIFCKPERSVAGRHFETQSMQAIWQRSVPRRSLFTF